MSIPVAPVGLDPAILDRLRGLEDHDTLILQSIDRLLKAQTEFNEIQRNRSLYPINFCSAALSALGIVGQQSVALSTDLRIDHITAWVDAANGDLLLLNVNDAAEFPFGSNRQGSAYPAPMFIRGGQRISITANSGSNFVATVWAWRQ